MKKEPSEYFEELLQKYTLVIENNCLTQIKKAKNKAFVQDKVHNQIRGVIRFHNIAISQHNKAFHYFIEKYNEGEDIEKIIAKIKKDDPKALKITPEIDKRENIELIPFGKEEEKILNEFAPEIHNIIKFHAGYLAFNEINKRIPNYLNPTKETSTIKYPFKWTGNKDNKNEFVQVIYGLHKAGLIDQGKGEITKIVEAIAEVFDVKLGENWQSNHSASIHKAKNNYQPLIFHKIREAYEQYSNSQVEHKKKTK